MFTTDGNAKQDGRTGGGLKPRMSTLLLSTYSSWSTELCGRVMHVFCSRCSSATARGKPLLTLSQDRPPWCDGAGAEPQGAAAGTSHTEGACPSLPASSLPAKPLAFSSHAVGKLCSGVGVLSLRALLQSLSLGGFE